MCYADGMLSTEKHSCFVLIFDFLFTLKVGNLGYFYVKITCNTSSMYEIELK